MHQSHDPRRSLVGACSILTLAACGTSPTTPATRSLNPSCALVAGEMSSGSAAAPRLLISERRGAPDAAEWHYIGDHHIPPPGAPPPAEFKWRTMIFAEEAAVRNTSGYQVNVVVGEIGGGRRMFHMTQVADGTWGPLRLVDNTVQTGHAGGPLGTDVGRAGIFKRVALASVDGRLHICATEGNGQIQRLVFDSLDANPYGGGWTDIELGLGRETGEFVDVGCAGVVNPENGLEELHVCGVTSDGRLWHAIESPRGHFSAFGDVSEQSGDVGRFERVACAGNAGQLHLVGLTTDHRAWYTARNATSWRQFENVFDAAPPAAAGAHGANYRDLAIGFCNADVPSDALSDLAQLNVILTELGDNNNQIWHTIRATNPVQWGSQGGPTNWRPLQDLGPVINRGSLSPVPRTTTPAYWGSFSVGYRPFPPY